MTHTCVDCVNWCDPNCPYFQLYDQNPSPGEEHPRACHKFKLEEQKPQIEVTRTGDWFRHETFYDLALLACQWSHISYMDDFDASQLPEDWDVHVEKNKDAEYWVAEHEQGKVIAIRGTDDTHEWLRNVNASTVNDCTINIHMHFGFYKHKIIIMETLLDHVSPIDPLLVTGHSLGGAVAKAIANDLVTQQYAVIDSHGFGAPRWAATGQSLHTTGHTWINFGDPVPRLPTRRMGYRHYGTLHAFNHYDDYLGESSALGLKQEQARISCKAVESLASEDTIVLGKSLHWARHASSLYVQNMTRLREQVHAT